jgi:D-lyxose ketol-isomerase
MKRSEINALLQSAEACFLAHGWTLPPGPQWDVTDFGLGDYRRCGLVAINLANEPEYCEKLMYARRDMRTPAHCHAKKKEDIICRWGELCLLLWKGRELDRTGTLSVKINGRMRDVAAGEIVRLQAGERITLIPGVYHEFYPASEECIIGEVSTANDDLHDNFFVNPDVGRFPGVDEDEAPLLKIVGDR